VTVEKGRIVNPKKRLIQHILKNTGYIFVMESKAEKTIGNLLSDRSGGLFIYTALSTKIKYCGILNKRYFLLEKKYEPYYNFGVRNTCCYIYSRMCN
jgi:hypothetical protein